MKHAKWQIFETEGNTYTNMDDLSNMTFSFNANWHKIVQIMQNN